MLSVTGLIADLTKGTKLQQISEKSESTKLKICRLDCLKNVTSEELQIIKKFR
jgi:ferredoxin-fold anticodon binding domain-containing protein